MDSIIDIVNINHHTTTTYIDNGCLNVASNSNNFMVQPEFKLYPNPTLNYVDVHYNLYDDDDLLLHLQNSIGDIVYSERLLNVKKGKYRIDLSNISAGIYIVNLQSTSFLKTMKLIKN